MTEHREGVNPAFLARHTLSLTGLNSADAGNLLADIDELPGVDRVRLKGREQTLKVAYDASRLNIDGVIAILEKYGASVKDSWWSRTRLGWQRQTDENIRDNARHEATCCSKGVQSRRYR